MRKNSKFISILSFSLVSLFSLGSCGNSNNNGDNGKVYIHILNAEDYIDEELIAQFNEANTECEIIYETYDTNETMYNELQTGKANYDLICCSEYMIQRLASEGLIQKISDLETYEENVSTYLVSHDSENPGIIDKINVFDKKTSQKLGILSEFAKGYMWGTLGILYNPTYSTFVSRGMEKEDIVEELNSENGWSAFWNPNYKGTQSIKDSMRDTYALGILEIYKDKFLDDSISYDDKNNIYFNDHSDEAIENVKNRLIQLKDNIFGFEVDSGKNDIVTKKIGMNLARSGDACFSILQGQYYPGEDESYEEEKPDGIRTELYYALPSSGANIWFDAWCMPKTVDKDSKNYEYACKFLDFLSEPESVTANMYCTGYTSFISGTSLEIEENPILSYLYDSYDMEGEEGVIDYDISYFFGTSEEIILQVDPDSWEGRTLKAQYPEESEIGRLYVMQDFGKDNNKIVKMWEDVKVNPLPTFVIVSLIIFVAAVLLYLGTYNIVKKYKVKKRKALRNK